MFDISQESRKHCLFDVIKMEGSKNFRTLVHGVELSFKSAIVIKVCIVFSQHCFGNTIFCGFTNLLFCFNNLLLQLISSSRASSGVYALSLHFSPAILVESVFRNVLSNGTKHRKSSCKTLQFLGFRLLHVFSFLSEVFNIIWSTYENIIFYLQVFGGPKCPFCCYQSWLYHVASWIWLPFWECRFCCNV